jgi:cytidine deaminase
MKPPQIVKKAYVLATESRENSYSPYSKFKVGAAVVSSKGRMFGGCNVENASYGGTICAERAAIVKAVSEGQKKFSNIMIVTDAKKLTPPCGMCLQVMAEFCDPHTKVWIGNSKEILKVFELSELLPQPFGPKSF